MLEGAAHAQCWGRAGRAELPSTACPALSVCPPGARNSLSYSTEKRRAALHWHLGQESTKDWNNSTVGFGCPTTAQGPPETPPRDSVEPEAPRGKHIYPDCLNAHLYHMAVIHKGKGRQGSSKCISSRDSVFYHNDSYNTKSNLSAFFSDLKSNSSALSLYLIRICCKASALKMRVKSIRKNPMKSFSLSIICCRHQPFVI